MESFQSIQLSFKCPKTLNELQPCQSNWNCDSCQKMVHDFRGMSEWQILAAFAQSGQKLCGVYDAERIKILPHKPKWHKWVSAAAMALGLLHVHEKVYAQKMNQPTDVQLKNIKVDSTENVIVGFMAVDIRANFPGGEAAFKKYVLGHVNYPGKYKGHVWVSFWVERDGTLSAVKIVKGGELGLNEEIVNVIKRSPHWRHAIQAGKVVREQNTLAIPFGLSD